MLVSLAVVELPNPLFQLCGLSDANKRFYPTAVAISSHEDAWCYKKFLQSIATFNTDQIYQPRMLIADGAIEITNGNQKNLG